MGEVQAAYPGDNEAAIFHALTLSITAPKTDKTFANQRGAVRSSNPSSRNCRTGVVVANG